MTNPHKPTTDELRSAIERVRWIVTDNVTGAEAKSTAEQEGLSEKFFDDVLLLARETIAANPPDDREEVSEEWLQQEYESERTEHGWCIHDDVNPIFLSRSNGSPDVWVAYIDGDYFPIDIFVRVQVRALVYMCQKL